MWYFIAFLPVIITFVYFAIRWIRAFKETDSIVREDFLMIDSEETIASLKGKSGVVKVVGKLSSNSKKMDALIAKRRILASSMVITRVKALAHLDGQPWTYTETTRGVEVHNESRFGDTLYIKEGKNIVRLFPASESKVLIGEDQGPYERVLDQSGGVLSMEDLALANEFDVVLKFADSNGGVFKFSEYIISEGDEVEVVGYYDAEQRALVETETEPIRMRLCPV